MLPDSEHDPASFLKVLGLFLIAPNVVLNLLDPPFGIRFWRAKMVGAAMPEAAIDKHADPCPRKHNIGFAPNFRLRARILAKTKPLCV